MPRGPKTKPFDLGCKHRHRDAPASARPRQLWWSVVILPQWVQNFSGLQLRPFAFGQSKKWSRDAPTSAKAAIIPLIPSNSLPMDPKSFWGK